MKKAIKKYILFSTLKKFDYLYIKKNYHVFI